MINSCNDVNHIKHLLINVKEKPQEQSRLNNTTLYDGTDPGDLYNYMYRLRLIGVNAFFITNIKIS